LRTCASLGGRRHPDHIPKSRTGCPLEHCFGVTKVILGISDWNAVDIGFTQ
jgi:hypothetical protein